MKTANLLTSGTIRQPIAIPGQPDWTTHLGPGEFIRDDHPQISALKESGQVVVVKLHVDDTVLATLNSDGTTSAAPVIADADLLTDAQRQKLDLDFEINAADGREPRRKDPRL